MTHGCKKIRERCTDKYFHIFIIELLSSYDSESRKIHTKAVVDVSESGGMGGGGGFWNMLCQRANDFNWGELTLGQLGVGGNHGLIKFLQVNVTIFRNIFKWWLLLMSI